MTEKFLTSVLQAVTFGGVKLLLPQFLTSVHLAFWPRKSKVAISRHLQAIALKSHRFPSPQKMRADIHKANIKIHFQIHRWQFNFLFQKLEWWGPGPWIVTVQIPPHCQLTSMSWLLYLWLPYLQNMVIEQIDIMKLNIPKHYANFKYENVKVNTL